MDILPLPAGRLRGLAPLTAEEMTAYVVAAAVWAPSVHNTQPWWFSAARQEISFTPTPGGG
jgi:nitroreductase